MIWANSQDIRTMLSTFSGAVARSTSTALEPHLTDSIIADWAPGIFQLLQAMCSSAGKF